MGLFEGDLLAHADVGAGAPVVLLHGLGTDHRMFAPQLRSLPAQVRVIAPDLRGCGDSPPLDVHADEVLDVQACDVVALLDHLGVAEAHVVGVGYGGVLAQRLLIDHPERVTSAVLCDTVSSTAPHTSIDRLAGLGARVREVPPLPSWVRRAAARPTLAITHRRWPEARDQVVRTMGSARSPETAVQRRAMADLDHRADLGKVTVPVLVMVGTDSGVLRRRALETAKAIPGARCRLLPDAVAPSNLCNPAAFDAELLAFVLQNRGNALNQ